MSVEYFEEVNTKRGKPPRVLAAKIYILSVMAKPVPAFVVLAAAVAKKSAARSGSLRTETGGQPNKNDILRRSRERIDTRSL